MLSPSTAEQLRALFTEEELEAMAKAKELLSHVDCEPTKLPEIERGHQKAFLT